jgi:hypothetical protein
MIAGEWDVAIKTPIGGNGCAALAHDRSGCGVVMRTEDAVQPVLA